LSTSRKAKRYIKTFKSIICCYSDHYGLQFKPTKITVDFEQGLQERIIKHTWADIEIVGYRFHVAQTWRRKHQTVDLNKEYKDYKSKIR